MASCYCYTLSSLKIYLTKKAEAPPPGPKPFPIIGHLHLIGSLPHRSVHELSKQYGPIMQLRFGSVPVVVASSAELAKTFLTRMDLTFAGRRKTAAGKYTTFNYSDMLWSPYGPYFRQIRKLCVTELFNAKRLESYEFIRTEELTSALRGLYKTSGKPVVLKDHLTTLSLNVISRMVLGKKYLEGAEEFEEFKKMNDELFLLNGVLNIGDYIKWLDFLDLQGYVKRMKAISKKFDRFLEHILDEHNSRREADNNDNNATKDMVDVLLDLANDPTQEVKLTRNQVKGFTQDLVAAGTESSAVTVEWAISEMLKKPETFKKAREELDRVIGEGRWVEERDMENLPYIKAIAKETMRRHPVAPMLGPRCAREDCKVNGYDILKGTLILVHVWTIGKDPAIWDDPEEFYPDGFVGNQIDVKGQHYELLPFGSGRRMCPGYALGLKVIESSLANVLHGFNWHLPDGLKPEDVKLEEIFGLSTPKKIPLLVVAEPRLPLDLY